MLDQFKVLQGVELIAALSSEEDEAVVVRLLKSGFSESEAELLTCFAPLAFGRLIIQEMQSCAGLKLADKVEIQNKELLSAVKIELNDIVFYKYLLAIAVQNLSKKKLSTNTFLHVGLRSPELKTVNLLLLEKRNLSEFTIASPLLMRMKPEWIHLEHL